MRASGTEEATRRWRPSLDQHVPDVEGHAARSKGHRHEKRKEKEGPPMHRVWRIARQLGEIQEAIFEGWIFRIFFKQKKFFFLATKYNGFDWRPIPSPTPRLRRVVTRLHRGPRRWFLAVRSCRSPRRFDRAISRFI